MPCLGGCTACAPRGKHRRPCRVLVGMALPPLRSAIADGPGRCTGRVRLGVLTSLAAVTVAGCSSSGTPPVAGGGPGAVPPASGPWPPTMFFDGSVDNRIEWLKQPVVGIEMGEDALAVDVQALRGDGVRNVTVDGRDLAVWWLPGARSSLDGVAVGEAVRSARRRCSSRCSTAAP